jgi:hypothetical protein
VIAGYLTQLATRAPGNFTAATLFLMGKMAERHVREAARMSGKIEKPWRKVRGRRWKAVRSRMQDLRAEVTESNGSDSRAEQRSAGNGTLGGANGGSASRPASGH